MYKISVYDRYHNYIELQAKPGETLFSVFSRHQPPVFKGNCGGRGQCMSCSVFVEEKRAYVKACRTIVEQDLHVVLPFSLGRTEAPKLLLECSPSDMEAMELHHHSYGAAIDIGTTSIGMCLMDLDKGSFTGQCHPGDVFEGAVCEYNLYNPQAVYGADVISRIAYARKREHAKHLQNLVWEQLLFGINAMLNEARLSSKNLTHISIAANTTMLHLLMGYDASGLGSYPFHTEHLQAIKGSLSQLKLDLPVLEQWGDVKLCIYPGCSAYVGADIIAGATALSLGEKEKYDLLIDLGTNGEILLVNANQGYAGATACGSAFDAYVTAGGYSTDLLSRLVLLKGRGIIRKNGSLMERYLESGYVFPDGVTITQEIIENILKAKAAIRTGLDMILEKAGITFDSCRVYVAGNFGFHLDLNAAKAIGMFPEGGEIMIAGNTSLEGAKRLLAMPQASIDMANAICSRTQVLEFANDSSFAKRYISQMTI